MRRKRHFTHCSTCVHNTTARLSDLCNCNNRGQMHKQSVIRVNFTKQTVSVYIPNVRSPVDLPFLNENNPSDSRAMQERAESMSKMLDELEDQGGNDNLVYLFGIRQSCVMLVKCLIYTACLGKPTRNCSAVHTHLSHSQRQRTHSVCKICTIHMHAHSLLYTSLLNRVHALGCHSFVHSCRIDGIYGDDHCSVYVCDGDCAIRMDGWRRRCA